MMPYPSLCVSALACGCFASCRACFMSQIVLFLYFEVYIRSICILVCIYTSHTHTHTILVVIYDTLKSLRTPARRLLALHCVSQNQTAFQDFMLHAAPVTRQQRQVRPYFLFFFFFSTERRWQRWSQITTRRRARCSLLCAPL